MGRERPDQVVEEDKYISIEEACQLLETNEKEVEELVSKGMVHAFKIGGQYIRLHKEQVSEIKAKWRINRELFPEIHESLKHVLAVDRSSAWERLKDFWYFNDFYMISLAVIAALLFLIFSAQ